MIGVTATQKFLVLTGSDTRLASLIDLLRSGHEVVVTHTMDAALQELRTGNIDAVFSDSADFLPLERALASQQSGLILDTIGEGICITDEQGQILWSNRRVRQWSPQVRKHIQHVCNEAWQLFTTQMTASGPPVGQSPLAAPAASHDAAPGKIVRFLLIRTRRVPGRICPSC